MAKVDPQIRVSAELNKKGDELQVNTLLYTMGDEADDIMLNFEFKEDDDNKKYKKVKEKFDGYFVIRNRHHLRASSL